MTTVDVDVRRRYIDETKGIDDEDDDEDDEDEAISLTEKFTTVNKTTDQNGNHRIVDSRVSATGTSDSS